LSGKEFVVESKCVVMPILRLFEYKGKVLKEFVSDIGFKSTFSDSHQAVNIFQNLESFLPQA